MGVFTCHNRDLIYDYGLQVFSRINTDYNSFRAMGGKISFSLRIEHSVKILPCLACIGLQLCRETQQRKLRRAWLLHINFSNCCLQSKIYNVIFIKWWQFICGVCEFWTLEQIRMLWVGSLIYNKSRKNYILTNSVFRDRFLYTESGQMKLLQVHCPFTAF